jgi:hypothetical protein
MRSPFYLLLIALGYLISFPGVVQSQNTTSGTPFRTETFDLGNSPVIQAELSGYSLSVTGEEGTSNTSVQAFLFKNGKSISSETEEAKEFLDRLELKISQSGSKLSILARQKSGGSWDSWRSGISMEIRVKSPKQLEVNAKSSGGSLAIRGISGSAILNSSGGSIAVDSSGGVLEVNSSGGSFSLTNFDGSAKVGSSGGSVSITKANGTLEVSSSGGSMYLSQLDATLSASSSGGSIKAELDRVTQPMSFSASGGAITVELGSAAAFDLLVKGDGIRTDLLNFQGTTTPNLMTGKVNGGGPRLELSSGGGSISLKTTD